LRPSREKPVSHFALSNANLQRYAGGTLDLHEMRRFAPSAPGGGGAGAQPFKLTVSPSAGLYELNPVDP
jgi:hypothetical protein